MPPPRVKVDAAACPRIAAQWLGEAKEEIGGNRFKQEFGCEFVQHPACLISRGLARRAIRQDIEPLFPDGADA